MLEERVARRGVAPAERDAARGELAGERVEALELLLIERLILGEGHHHAGEADVLARGQIADERRGLGVGHADAADAGVDADVDVERPRQRGGRLLELGADRRVDHRHDVAWR